MRKRCLFFSVALAAALVGVASAAETVSVVEKVVSEKTVDVGPKGDSMGDILVFANPVFDTAGAVRLGSDNGHCVRTEVGKAWDCTWTLILKDGEIIAAGPFYDSVDSNLAIIGGTGKYLGSKGSLLVHARDGSSYDFKYSLM